MREIPTNPFDVIGVPRDTEDEAVVIKAKRRMASKYHTDKPASMEALQKEFPDKNEAEIIEYANEWSKAINLAWEQLKDPAKRENFRYESNHKTSSGFNSSSSSSSSSYSGHWNRKWDFGEGSFEDYFDDIFSDFSDFFDQDWEFYSDFYNEEDYRRWEENFEKDFAKASKKDSNRKKGFKVGGSVWVVDNLDLLGNVYCDTMFKDEGDRESLHVRDTVNVKGRIESLVHILAKGEIMIDGIIERNVELESKHRIVFSGSFEEKLENHNSTFKTRLHAPEFLINGQKLYGDISICLPNVQINGDYFDEFTFPRQKTHLIVDNVYLETDGHFGFYGTNGHKGMSSAVVTGHKETTIKVGDDTIKVTGRHYISDGIVSPRDDKGFTVTVNGECLALGNDRTVNSGRGKDLMSHDDGTINLSKVCKSLTRKWWLDIGKKIETPRPSTYIPRPRNEKDHSLDAPELVIE